MVIMNAIKLTLVEPGQAQSQFDKEIQVPAFQEWRSKERSGCAIE